MAGTVTLQALEMTVMMAPTSRAAHRAPKGADSWVQRCWDRADEALHAAVAGRRVGRSSMEHPRGRSHVTAMIACVKGAWCKRHGGKEPMLSAIAAWEQEVMVVDELPQAADS